MPSPFPGVDPYLESQYYWPDFHHGFIIYWRDALADQLPENYEARIDEYVHLVELPSEKTKSMMPDVGIMQRGPSSPNPSGHASSLLLEPVTVPLEILDEERSGYIRILHRPERILIAVLELLSPSNKTYPGLGEYLAKRNSILRQDVHLVELDLLLEGQRPPMQRPLPAGDYYALVSRAEHRPNCEVYAWTMRQPLPTIRIPLKAPDPDIQFDLGSVFALAYERGRYARSIDYNRPLELPLEEEEKQWVMEQARKRSLMK